MPTATIVARATPASVRRARRAGSRATSRLRDPRERRGSWPPRRGARGRRRRGRSAGRPAARSASASASNARKVSSPAVSAMNAASHARVGLAQRGQPQHPERHRHHPDEQPDEGVAGHARAARPRASRRRPGIVGSPSGCRSSWSTPTVYGSSSTQSKGISIVGRAQPLRPSAARRGSNGTIASSTVTERDRDVLGLGVARPASRISPARNSTRRTSSSSAGGGFAPTSAVSELPDGSEGGGRGDQQHDRHEREQPRRPAARPRRTGGEPVVASVVDNVEEAHPAELGELRSGARGT